MAIIDVISYGGTGNDFAWMYPNDELGTWTQLVVNESMEAVLYKGGAAQDVLTSGRHTLHTKNIPLVRNIVNIPFGGESPFKAQVWFVNKISSLDIKWGTKSPMQLQDPKYNIYIPVRSFGQFGIKIQDSRKFLTKLVGTATSFDKEVLKEYFKGIYLTKVKDIVASYLVKDKVSILEMSAYLEEISEFAHEKVKDTFDEYGIELINFNINSVNFPENDPGVLKLREALAKRAEMDIIGYTYGQERSFDTMESAASNEGTMNSTFMGAGMGLSMGAGVGGKIASMMNGLNTETRVEMVSCPNCGGMVNTNRKFCGNCGNKMGQQNEVKEEKKIVKCNKCGNIIPDGSKFCANCGDVYNPCPNCGHDVDLGCKVCSDCGHKMPVSCSNCNADVPGDSKFCSSCGNKMINGCPECGNELDSGAKFCPNCGTKI